MPNRSSQPWIPEFFVGLESKGCACTTTAKKHHLRLVKPDGKLQLYGLSQAASKWRVANAAAGLDAAILTPKAKRQSSTVPDDEISQELCDSYSAQFVIALSVIAFENYSKCFGVSGRNWKQQQQAVFQIVEVDASLAARFRNLAVKRGLDKKIADFLTKIEQRQRVSQFFESGDDQLLYDMCHFIRHGYAHGALMGYHDLKPIAGELKKFVLDSIRNHANYIARDISPSV